MIELCIPRYDSKHLYGIYSHAETKDLIYEYKTLVKAFEAMESIDNDGYGTPMLFEIGMGIRTILTDVMASRLCTVCADSVTDCNESV